MKKIIALVIVLVMILACVGCSRIPDEIIKDKKLTATNATNYLNIKCKIDNMTTNFEAELDEEEGDMDWRLLPSGTLVIDVTNSSTYETEFEECMVTVSVDAGVFGEKSYDVQLDEKGNGSVSVDVSARGYRSEAKTYYPTPNPTYTITSASGRVKTHIPYEPEESE